MKISVLISVEKYQKKKTERELVTTTKRRQTKHALSWKTYTSLMYIFTINQFYVI